MFQALAMVNCKLRQLHDNQLPTKVILIIRGGIIVGSKQDGLDFGQIFGTYICMLHSQKKHLYYTDSRSSPKPRHPSTSYTIGCPPVREDNPQALASGLSYVQRTTHSITIVYHQHQSGSCTAQAISC